MKKILLALIAGCAALQLRAAELNWQADLPKALAQAKTENKLVLVNFTGSDWCPWCIKLDKDTYSQPEFADYAKKNLVLVVVDFPRSKSQPDDLKKANEALAKKYSVNGLPTEVALKPDGTLAWKNEGYLPGGPSTMIAELDKAKKK